VTLGSDQKIEGRLVRIDDFIVTLTDSEGTQRTFRRDGDKPHVEITNRFSRTKICSVSIATKTFII